MDAKYYDLILILVQVLLVIAWLNTSGFVQALIVIVQAILLFMQFAICDDK